MNTNKIHSRVAACPKPDDACCTYLQICLFVRLCVWKRLSKLALITQAKNKTGSLKHFKYVISDHPIKSVVSLGYNATQDRHSPHRKEGPKPYFCLEIGIPIFYTIRGKYNRGKLCAELAHCRRWKAENRYSLASNKQFWSPRFAE